MQSLEDPLDRDPHDETAFLVYADALLERGNPHGELIRLQHALAQNPNDAELVAREAVLRKNLMPSLGSLGVKDWKLGFPRALHLLWVGDENAGELATMLRSRLCRFIEAVTLADYVTGERVAELLALLPHLAEVSIEHNLEVLSSRSALKVLESLSGLSKLQRLRLKTHSATVLLTELPAFPQLQQLTLSGTRLVAEDVPMLERARKQFARGCELKLEGGTCSLDVERRVTAVWPFVSDDARGPGLLVEAPRSYRGCQLLANGSELRIGHHLACELSLSGCGLRAVHSVFDGKSLREAGDLSTPPRVLSDGDRVELGDAVLRFCLDVHAQRELLKRTE